MLLVLDGVYRLLPSIIQHAVLLYYRFNLSVRDVEDMLAERSISVSYETIWLWINKFGPEFTKRFFQQFLKSDGVPIEIVTDKLRSYAVAH